jgi:hypothetical protein
MQINRVESKYNNANANVQYLYHAKIKHRKLIKALLSVNLLALDATVGTSANMGKHSVSVPF